MNTGDGTSCMYYIHTNLSKMPGVILFQQNLLKKGNIL